jgi:hypothetical protein
MKFCYEASWIEQYVHYANYRFADRIYPNTVIRDTMSTYLKLNHKALSIFVMGISSVSIK